MTTRTAVVRRLPDGHVERPEHQAWRWTHVGLLAAGESFYLYNAITGIGMFSKDRPGLTAQDLHRYAFFTHGSLMLARSSWHFHHGSLVLGQP